MDEERDAELDDDRVDEYGVDEEEISASTPYLARQMLCLGRVTPGVKDTSFLGSVCSAKEAGDLFAWRKIVGDEHRWCKRNKHTRTRRSTQVQAARRLTALLLHVWIDIILVSSYKGCSDQGTRQGRG